MSLGCRPLKPETDGDRKLAETPNGMRNLIWRHSFNDGLTRRAFDIAARQGLSGEDLYVTLAYHALLMAERLQEQFLRLIERTAMPPMMVLGPITDSLLEKDAARYRYMRASFTYSGSEKHRLDWFLPHVYCRYDKPLNEQLDDSIDAAIARKS